MLNASDDCSVQLIPSSPLVRQWSLKWCSKVDPEMLFVGLGNSSILLFDQESQVGYQIGDLAEYL